MASDSKPKKGAMPEGSVLGLKQDKLSREQLQALYQYTARQVEAVPGLQALMQQAWKGQWTKPQFDAEVEKLDWYRKNAASVREFMLLQAEGGADFTEKTKDSVEAVRQKALEVGVNLSPQRMQELAHNSMMFGWGDPGQEYELVNAIVESGTEGGQYGGDIAANTDNLNKVALANNVKVGPEWVLSKAKAVAKGWANAEDVERELREMAAEATPLFADRIRAGEDYAALISPWRRMMADEWELAPDAIPLDDPMLSSAVGGFDDKGNPKKEDLGSFQMRLRKDPRWLTTAAGQNKSIDAYSGVLQMFGYGN